MSFKSCQSGSRKEKLKIVQGAFEILVLLQWYHDVDEYTNLWNKMSCLSKISTIFLLNITFFLYMKFQYAAMMTAAAAAAAAIRKSNEKIDNNNEELSSILYHRNHSTLAGGHHHHHHHHHHGDHTQYSALGLATLAALHQDRLLASKNSSIADLRLKAKKHAEALLLERTSDKQMETV